MNGLRCFANDISAARAAETAQKRKAAEQAAVLAEVDALAAEIERVTGKLAELVGDAQAVDFVSSLLAAGWTPPAAKAGEGAIKAGPDGLRVTA